MLHTLPPTFQTPTCVRGSFAALRCSDMHEFEEEMGGFPDIQD